jgi:hypothetical protein
MRIRIDRRLSDLAGSGLVLLGFLLATMALSAAPPLLHSMTVHGAPAAPGSINPLPAPETALA